MERFKKYYKSDGFLFLYHKIKYYFNFTNRLKVINIYQNYVPLTNIKQATKFHSLIEENYKIDSSRKIVDPYNIIERFKLNLLNRVNESELINCTLAETNYEIINKNIVTLCKYFHSANKNFCDRKLRKILNNFIRDISPNLDLITLIYIFSANFFNQNKYGDNLIILIEEKLIALRTENKIVIDKYLDTNIKDNSIIYYLIHVLSNSFAQDVIFEFFISILERRIIYLNLTEAITCSIFLLENRLMESYILKSLSIRIVQICNSKNFSLDVDSYQLIFNNLSLFKILLDYNKLSFDNHTESIIEDIFYNYNEICNLENYLEKSTNDNSLINNSVNEKSVNKSNGKNLNKNNSKINSALKNNKKIIDDPSLVPEQNFHNSTLINYHMLILENTFYSNLNLVLSKNNYNVDEIETIFSNFNNEIHDFNYFRRLSLKKNPFDVFLLIKIISKNSHLGKKIKNELLQKIIDKAINCFFNLENNINNKIFFILNISLAKDIAVMLKILNSEDEKDGICKINSLHKILKISYRKMILYYEEIRNFLLIDFEKENPEISETVDKEEMKHYFITLALQFFELFSMEKKNEKYIYYKDKIMEDIKNLVSLEVFNKKDLRLFVSLLKKDYLICEEFKNNIIKTNNYYF